MKLLNFEVFQELNDKSYYVHFHTDVYMVSNLSVIINDFIKEIVRGNIEIYNEASIQYELAIFLRSQIPNYKIQLERNIQYFDLNKNNFLKKEMDVVVFSDDKKVRHCVEIKYPRQGQVPVQMYKSCQDVRFLEQLRNTGFESSFFLMFTEDHLFYDNKGGGAIYEMFRVQKEMSGLIVKSTGKPEPDLNLTGNYKINWKPVINNLLFFIIEI